MGAFPYNFGSPISSESALNTALAANFVQAATETWVTAAIDAAVAGVVAGMVTDHGSLTGLSDDDHPQYLNNARGDARYWPLTTDLATQAELDAEATTRAAADTALDGRLDTLEAVDNATQAELDTHKSSSDHDGRYYTEAEVDALIAGRASDAELSALQAEVDADEAALAAHLVDTSEAHIASAISVTPTGDVAATNVQSAIAELSTDKATTGSVTAVQSNLDTHIADATAAHQASAISNSPSGNVASTNVQSAINELDADLTAHLGDTSDAHDASAISVSDAGSLFTATNVEDVLAELAIRAPVGLPYEYDTDITNSDPGAGKFRFDNASIASATKLRISITDGAANDIDAELATWDDSTNSIRGTLLMHKGGSPGTYAVINITGAATDNTTWWEFPVSTVMVGGTFTDTNDVTFLFLRSGNVGATGATGATGTAGSQIYSSIGAPAGGTGVDGDWNFNVSTGEVYQKQSGSWALMFNTTGPAGAAGTDGVDADGGLTYVFDSTTTMADPGAGELRTNNAAQASVTQMTIDLLDADGNDVTGYLGTWDDSTSTVKGTVVIRQAGDPTRYYMGNVTVITVGGTHATVTVSPVSGGSSFANGATLSVVFVRAGDQGTAGVGLPTGGSAGQFLRKSSGTNYDVAFAAIAQSEVTNLVSDLAAKQPLDSDLTAIASLTATTDNFIQAKSSAWASRTPTQVAADLGANGLIANSLLTTRGDLIRRGASAPERVALGSLGSTFMSDGTDAVWVAPTARVKHGSFTAPASTGNKVVTGVGFQPVWVEFEVVVVNTDYVIGGRGSMEASGGQWSSGHIYRRATALGESDWSTSRCINLPSEAGAGLYLGAAFVSMDSDGFTINFSSTNTTFSILWRAHR